MTQHAESLATSLPPVSLEEYRIAEEQADLAVLANPSSLRLLMALVARGSLHDDDVRPHIRDLVRLAEARLVQYVGDEIRPSPAAFMLLRRAFDQFGEYMLPELSHAREPGYLDNYEPNE